MMIKSISILCLMLIVSPIISAEPIQLYYATTSPDGNEGSALYGSLRGGTMIYINGVGFPQDSTMLMVYLGDFPCQIPAEGVTTNFISCETTDSYSDSNQANLPIKVIVGG